MISLNWKEHNDRSLKVKTPTLTVCVRSGRECWLWTVHNRIPEFRGKRLLGHGRETLRSEAVAHAEAWLLGYGEGKELAFTQPPVRIYFDGCEGSGKTTLARNVAQQYGLPLLTEVASAVLYEFQQRVGERASSFERIRADVALSTEVQERVFQRQLDDEKALPPPAVYDRTLSCLAYAELYASNYASLLSRVPAEYIDNLRQSVVFLVRPQRGLAATTDWARAAVTWENQVRIDQTIEVLLQTWDVKFVSIDMLSATARQCLIDWCLTAKGFKKS